MTVGYARISTPGQQLSVQTELLKENGCERIFTDIASGVREDREGLNEMLSYLRKGDIILVYKTDRIFRSLKNMIELIEKFNKKGVLFKSLTEPAFDTTSANGKFIIQIFGAVAEFERNLISERTKSGLEGARKRKKLLGRPKGASQGSIEKYQFAKHLYDSKGIPVDKACKQAGISKTTFYRIDREKNNY
ncbi:recombinase family protein [Chryseobacterium indologenes]|uniref:recombinase family protein n=1 Tax=Chryseobacterium indologenes TaxID=253 RepID=UPI0003E06716|nr:recombinase family protein [Chryseobacterium indologenes]QPQ53274.1 recombinase family protein [Chryseobacterium indologenes]GAE63569.1 putative site-specific recombinase [Chryseobacterium indologenes NBRC 14944]SFJ64574.1 Site-specific DNA recombinase [Chryseobacterium indologenes]SUX52095.1 DNA-invertase hin [Chryseobacterium indologenes]